MNTREPHWPAQILLRTGGIAGLDRECFFKKTNEIQTSKPPNALQKEMILSRQTREQERAGRLSEVLPQNFSADHYLDVGCGDGSISKAVGERVMATRITGVDVYDQEIDGLSYINISESGLALPLEDASCDLVTCFVSIHHFEKQNLLADIARVLRPGGYLVIREHDVEPEPDVASFLEMVHWVDAVARNDSDGFRQYCGFFAYEDISKTLESLGFSKEKMVRYADPNPQRIYHASFQKTSLGQESMVPLRVVGTECTMRRGNLHSWIQTASAVYQSQVERLLRQNGFDSNHFYRHLPYVRTDKDMMARCMRRYEPRGRR